MLNQNQKRQKNTKMKQMGNKYRTVTNVVNINPTPSIKIFKSVV